MEHNRKIRNEANEILRKFIVEKAKELEKKPCHIEVGQTAILNIYSIGRNGNNGWDGGPRSLLHNIKSKIKEPVTVKITDIYVDESLAGEIMDKYLENHSQERLEQLLKREALVGDYQVWLEIRKKNQSLGNEYGLYRTALFDTDDEFKPKWGLNTDSFLPYGSKEYQETHNVWAQEIDLYRKKEMVDLKIKELEQQKRDIDEKYKGIKYIN
jgi:predicted transcriptional regulator